MSRMNFFEEDWKVKVIAKLGYSILVGRDFQWVVCGLSNLQ